MTSEAITFVVLMFGFWMVWDHFVSVPPGPCVAAFSVLFCVMYVVDLIFVLETQKKASDLKLNKRTNTTCIETVFIIVSILSLSTIIVLVLSYAIVHMQPNEGVKRTTTPLIMKILFCVFVPLWAGMVPSGCRILAIKERLERDETEPAEIEHDEIEHAKVMDAAYAPERTRFVREMLDQIYKEMVVARHYTLAEVKFDFDPETARSVGLVPEGRFVRLVERKVGD